MNTIVPIPKDKDSKNPKIVFPDLCSGCLKNKVDVKSIHHRPSSITTDNLHDFYTAQIVYIGNINRVAIPQLASWVKIPACEKCAKKSRKLMLLMYFFEILGWATLILSFILGFALSTIERESLVPILGSIFGIGLWGLLITVLTIKYSFKIKHLKPEKIRDVITKHNFQISNEEYAKEILRLNNCLALDADKRKYCSNCNLLLHEPEIVIQNKGSQAEKNSFLKDICSKCGNKLVNAKDLEEHQSLSFQNLKSEVFNIRKPMKNVSMINGCLFPLSGTIFLGSFILALLSVISFANLVFIISGVIAVIALIGYFVTAKYELNVILNEICRILNTDKGMMLFFNNTYIVTRLFFSKGCFAFIKPNDESSKVYEIVKINRDQVTSIEPIFSPLTFQNILNYNTPSDSNGKIETLLSNINPVLIEKLIDNAFPEKEEKANLHCGIKLHFIDNSFHFFSYHFQAGVAIHKENQNLSDKIKEVLKSLIPLEKENFIIKS